MKSFITFKKRNEIIEVKKISNKIYNRYFILSYEKNNSNMTKVLFVLTKKNFKTSVKRNLIKRRLREILRIYCEKNNLFFHNLVFFCRSSLVNITYEEMKIIVFDLLNNIENETKNLKIN